MISYKINFFKDILKTEVHSIELYINNQRTIFRANVFIFSWAIVQNQVKVMTFFFETQFCPL